MEDKKKRGRPVKENKKIYMMNIRLTDDEKAELMDFAHKNSTTMTGVVLKGLDLLMEEEKNKKDGNR